MDGERMRNGVGKAFDGVKTFCATMAREREQLGDKVTDWLSHNPGAEIVDAVVTQSSDEEFHCLAITLFFRRAAVAG
ncbi:MAG TPA: hypothetical protein VKZ18_11255 [Polyangia bacterium]|nr:hypothetical protein [Polyangia bacterium]